MAVDKGLAADTPYIIQQLFDPVSLTRNLSYYKTLFFVCRWDLIQDKIYLLE